MIDNAISRIQRAIYDAENIGAYEVVEGLKPLEESLVRRKCRMGMELNGMTGYCLPGCCNNWDDCHKENGFGKDGENVADHANRNWFGGTGTQPSKPVMAG